MLFNLFLLNCVMKLSNYCSVLIYILQTLGNLIAMRFQRRQIIQVWILMTIRICQMPRLMRPVQRDLLLVVRQYRLFLGATGLIED